MLVTGANGYVASWLVKQLLEQGCVVHATVRNQSNQDKIKHLLDLANKHSGRLKLFDANLLETSAFDAAMAGCGTVFHTASPFIMRNLKDPQTELIEPAVEGTRNLLMAVNRTDSVKRVVLTSSTVAIYGDAKEVLDLPNGRFDESIWNTSSSAEHQAYSYSKTLAEHEAWRIAEQQNNWDLVVINPGFILGPSLAKQSQSESIKTMLELMRGKLKSGAPALAFPIVDVRDVAQAHIQAASIKEAKGRHCIVSATGSMLEMAEIIEQKFPGRFKLPQKEAPKWLLWSLAPLLKLSRRFVSQNIGYRPEFDNGKARTALQLNFRPIAETIGDHAEQLVADKLVR